MRLASVIAALAIMTAIYPSPTAAAPISNGGVDVAPSTDGGATVVVQGSHAEVTGGGAGAQSAGVSSGGGGGASGGGGGAPAGPPMRNVPFEGGYRVENAETGDQTGVYIELSNGSNWCADGGAGVVCNLITDTPLSPDVGMPATPVTFAQVMTIVSSAVAALQIEPVDIGIVPEPTHFLGGRTGLVGNHSWIWVDRPRESTVGPINRTVTSGVVTVSLNAINTGLVVNYGDGSMPYPCPVQSIPYFDAAFDLPSPTCNHHLERTSILEPGQVFKPSVTSLWLVSWSAATPGQTFTGVIPVTPTATTEVRVGELQVLVTPGS